MFQLEDRNLRDKEEEVLHDRNGHQHHRRSRCRLNEMRVLRRSFWVAQAANTAAFFASDLADATTGIAFNPTSGTVVD